MSPERAFERRAVAGFGSAGLDMDGINRNKNMVAGILGRGRASPNTAWQRGHLANAIPIQSTRHIFSFDKRSELRLWDHEFFLMSASRKG